MFKINIEKILTHYSQNFSQLDRGLELIEIIKSNSKIWSDFRLF